MRKLKVPVLVENSDLPKKMKQREFKIWFDKAHYEFIPKFDFWVEGFILISDVEYSANYYYLYAFIGSSKYYDYAIIKTDDFHFKTYAGWKKAVKAMAAQLVKRWKAWVRGLYEAELRGNA